MENFKFPVKHKQEEGIILTSEKKLPSLFNKIGNTLNMLFQQVKSNVTLEGYDRSKTNNFIQYPFQPDKNEENHKTSDITSPKKRMQKVNIL